MNSRIVFSLLISFFILGACKEDSPIPKPPTYLKANLPAHNYHKEVVEDLFSFDVSDLYTLKSSNNCNYNYCEQEIDLGREINGVINLFYKRVAHKDSLPSLINFSNKEVCIHRTYKIFITFKLKRVFGTLFELKGNVATNYQFYLTDSTENFLRGEVLLNCVPNYDSLRNVLAYIKEDLEVMMNTFEWKKK